MQRSVTNQIPARPRATTTRKGKRNVRAWVIDAAIAFILIAIISLSTAIMH